MQTSIVRGILPRLFAICCAFVLMSCGGDGQSSTSAEEVEICLDQGGEWAGECAFANEYCAIRARCKPNADFCPCDTWKLKD